jgi:hypothetical protein
VVTKAVPKEPPRFRRRLKRAEALFMLGRGMKDMVRKDRGTKKKAMPTAWMLRPRMAVPMSICRVKPDMNMS